MNFSFATAAVPPAPSWVAPGVLIELDSLACEAKVMRLRLVGAALERTNANDVVVFAASESNTGLILLAAASNIRLVSARLPRVWDFVPEK